MGLSEAYVTNACDDGRFLYKSELYPVSYWYTQSSLKGFIEKDLV